MIDKFQKTLGLSVFPEEFIDVFKASMEEYERESVFFLKDDYLQKTLEETGGFSRVVEETFADAKAIREDREAAEYAIFLYRAMEKRQLFMANLELFDFPEKYPFFAFLCLMPAIVNTHKYLTEKGIDRDIVKKTVGQYEECLFVYRERFDRLGMNKRYFDHLQGYVDNKFLNVDRLRYEIMKNEEIYVLEGKDGEQIVFLQKGRMNADGLYADTPPVTGEGDFDAFFEEQDEYFVGTPIDVNGRCENRIVKLDKNEYSVRLRPGDDCISVHIPSQGSLSKETCDQSYQRALRTFAEFYPELAPKAFHCHSWMMAPELRDILKPESKILGFQEPYKKYPVETEGKDVMNFVFKLKFKTYDDLAEDTSLQRALKKLYLSGQYLYEYCGIIII